MLCMRDAVAKLRIPDRMSERTGWIAVTWLAVPFGLVIFAIAGLVAFAQYSSWLNGYSTLICEVQTSDDAVSPSGHWIARIERSEGCDFGEGPWLDVAVIPNDRPRFLARHTWVFYRSLGGVQPGSDRMAIKWADDGALELRTPPCAPACRTWNDASQRFVPTGAKPCETACTIPSSVAGVTISVRPPTE